MTLMLRASVSLAGALLLATAGCSYGGIQPTATAPTPSEASPATTTSAPTTASTPEATASASPNGELGVGPPWASAESKGIAVELWLQSAQVRVGEDLVVLVRLKNSGPNAVQREGNTCGGGPAPAKVVQDAGERHLGKAWDGVAAEFKKRVLEAVGLGEGETTIGILVDAKMAHPGPIQMGCAAFSKPEQFVPGAVDQMAVVWPAQPAQGSLLRPGAAAVRATFTSLVEPGVAGPEPLVVEAEANFKIVDESAPGADVLPPIVAYVDAALSHQHFLDWLQSAPVETWINPLVSYWPSRQGTYPPRPPFDALGGRPVVEIGLATSGPNPDGVFRTVIIDQATAEVLAERVDP